MADKDLKEKELADKDMTDVKTLWSETILEILYTSLERKKTDKEIKKILIEVRSKGYSKDYIIKKVENKLDEQATRRVRNLLAGK